MLELQDAICENEKRQEIERKVFMEESYLGREENRPVDNYAMVCEKWRKIYLGMDHEELKKRFQMESDADAYYITYYNQKYRLDKKSGMITLKNAPECRLPFNTIMSIYNLFYYAKPDAKVCGEFVPFRLVKRASPFEAAFRRTVLDPLAKTFDGRAELMKKACLALGGKPVRQGDVGYVLDAFFCMPVTVLFWDGDDEFAAQANILFDADITDFIHEETVCCIASDLVRRLTEEAGAGKMQNLPGAQA